MNNSSTSEPSNYRIDIDGLRAIAVIFVVGFHAFPTLFHSGFIGVDVFFVISGFLISTILFKGLENNKFNFNQFYFRRIKRIFPALITVLTFCYALGWFVLLDDEFRQLGKHIAGGSGFVSNFILLNESGYFDNNSATKPLLHLWSLSIEEQFYILWPLILWIGYKIRLKIFYLILSIFFISFFYSIYEIRINLLINYYSPLTRFWELLIGSILAWIKFKKFEQENFYLSKIYKSKYRNIIYDLFGLFGFIAIIIACFFTDKSSFPGWWALLPTLGAFFLLFAENGSWINRNILSNSILRWYGLISFPLYLWHWPLLSFAYIASNGVPSVEARIVAIVFSIFFSWLTYRYIETPIRFKIKYKQIHLILILCASIIGSLGYNCFIRNGLQSRSVVKLSEESGSDGGDEKMSIQSCGITNAQDQKIFANCLQDSRETPKYALIGDSKADSIYKGLVRTSLPNARWLFIGGAGLDDVPVPVLTENKAYSKYQKASAIALKEVSNNKNIDKVLIVIAARSIFQVESPYLLSPDNKHKNYDDAFNGLNKALDILIKSGKKVVLLIDNPTLSDPKHCLIRKTKFDYLNTFFKENKNPACHISIGTHLKLSEPYLKLIQNISNKDPNKIKIFDTVKYLCDFQTGFCSSHKNNRLLYSYSDHISDYAAGLIGKDLNIFLQNF